jgi:hypothetical protein
MIGGVRIEVMPGDGAEEQATGPRLRTALDEPRA